MSLILMVFYWVAIPLFGFLGARWLWRRARMPFFKGVVGTIAVAGLLGWFWLIVGEKLWLDQQVRKLCAKDGGVKVYETVRLPPARLNKYGQINFYRPIEGENALGPEYVFKRETFYYRHGNPDLFQIHTKVIRRLDGKLLGESVFYKRGGGDPPGPWQGTSFICPEPSAEADVLHQVFVVNGKE